MSKGAKVAVTMWVPVTLTSKALLKIVRALETSFAKSVVSNAAPVYTQTKPLVLARSFHLQHEEKLGTVS
jgi:hypothetical protein